MILDVGCGANPHPRSSVNIDLYFGEVSPDIHVYLDPRKVENPIKADAEHLPLRAKIFEKTYSRALLEHLNNPTRALLEMVRVTKSEIELIIPHRFFRNRWWSRPPKEHKWFFGVKQVKRWLNSLNLKYRLKLERKPFPSHLLALLWLPHLIKIEIYT